MPCLLSSGCQITGEYDKYICLAVGLGAMVLGIRALVRWEGRHRAARAELLRNGEVRVATLSRFEITASSPGGKVPGSFVRLSLTLDGSGAPLARSRGAGTDYQLARLEPGMKIHLRSREPGLGDAIVDWDRTLGS